MGDSGDEDMVLLDVEILTVEEIQTTNVIKQAVE